jgi:hypothetical protein
VERFEAAPDDGISTGCATAPGSRKAFDELAMDRPSDSHEQQLALMGLQLLDEFRTFEHTVAAMAATMAPELVEMFTERAIDEVLVDFARSTRSPQASLVHIALGRRLREGVRRRLDELRYDPR